MKGEWSLVTRYWVLTLLAILLGGFLWYAHELINPLVIGALIAFVLNPAIEFLTKRTRISTPLAVTIVFILGLGGIAALSVALVPMLVEEIQLLFVDFQAILAEVQAAIAQPVVVLGWEFHFERVMSDFPQLFSNNITTLPGNAFHLLEATSKNLVWILVILATVYYLLRDWRRLRAWVLELFPPSSREEADQILDEINHIWHGYLRGNLALMLIVGTMFSLAWLIIGVPGALILGIITGILTIIPDLGPAIAAGLATIVALFEGSTYLDISNFWFALLVVGVYFLLINIKGIWIRPRIFARSVHMHDGVVFIAIMGSVVLQGILGALIIVPLLASLGVLGRHIHRRLLGVPGEEPKEDGSEEDEVQDAA